MKIKNLLFFSFLLLGISSHLTCYSIEKKGPKTFRMMSYNVRIGIGMDDQINLDRTARVINDFAPDVVAIQEIDSITERVNGAEQMVILGEKTNMHYIFGHAVDRSGGKYGIGLLSKEKPISVRKVHLPGSEEPRLLIIVEFKDKVICSTHFSLVEADQVTSAKIVLEELKDIKKPILLGGDFNAVPGSEPIKILQSGLLLLTGTDQATWPSDKPEVCIDYIWGKNIKNKNALNQSAVIDERMASDHRPIFIDIKLK